MDLSLRTETFQQEDQRWLGSEHGTNMGRSITLDVSMFTSGTHYPNGYFPSGLPVALITGTGQGGVIGLYGPYLDAATDGRSVLAGFLLCTVDAPTASTTDVQGALFEHGRVIEANLPIAIDAAGKTDVAGRIIFA
jgi:hypothetical protein